MHIFKQGATFAVPITASNDGQPFDINTYTIDCHLNKLCGALIEVLIIERTVDSNKFILKSGGTTLWPIGFAVLDIKITKNNVITKSESFTFQIIRSETP